MMRAVAKRGRAYGRAPGSWLMGEGSTSRKKNDPQVRLNGISVRLVTNSYKIWATVRTRQLDHVTHVPTSALQNGNDENGRTLGAPNFLQRAVDKQKVASLTLSAPGITRAF